MMAMEEVATAVEELAKAKVVVAVEAAAGP